MIIVLISLVPASISYSFAYRSSRPVTYSFMYLLPAKQCMVSKFEHERCEIPYRLKSGAKHFLKGWKSLSLADVF